MFISDLFRVTYFPRFLITALVDRTAVITRNRITSLLVVVLISVVS